MKKPAGAKLRQAEAARAQFADWLGELGAHAVGVNEASSRDGWEVIAYVEPTRAFKGPDKLTATVGGKKVEVPLRVERAETFKPE
jgi:hypothetical protein